MLDLVDHRKAAKSIALDILHRYTDNYFTAPAAQTLIMAMEAVISAMQAKVFENGEVVYTKEILEILEEQREEN